MSECTYSVMVRKTVQVKQYEPTVVELRIEGTCIREQADIEHDRAFKEIKARMNEFFKVKAKTPGFLD